MPQRVFSGPVPDAGAVPASRLGQSKHGTGPSPALIRHRGHGRQTLYAGTEPNWTLLHLPASQLEDALHGVFVEAQQGRNGAIAERWLLVDHGLDRFSKARLHLRRRLDGLVVQSSACQSTGTAY